ncbi:zinc finger MYM-type protein 1 [Trichonephila clavipes]|nr:zinc finger MYM-type protein 1 [Trichonephila clavipes]
MEQSNKNITNSDAFTSVRERNLAKENGEIQANINDENIQDLDDQQLLKKIMFSQRTLVTPRLKSVKKIGFKFEKYVEVGSWLKSISNSFIYYIISHEISYFQNKDPMIYVVSEETLQRFNSVNKKLQAPGFDSCEGNKLIMSFKTFISNIRHESYQKLKEYQDEAKKLSPSIETEDRDKNKRRVISKFADKSTEKAVYGLEKFKRHAYWVRVTLGKRILDLNRRI